MSRPRAALCVVSVTILGLFGSGCSNPAEASVVTTTTVPSPTVTAASLPAPTAPAVTTTTISPDQARAIAWTAAVAAHDRFMAALMPRGTTPAMWAALRRCEAGGNYHAVSRSGTYRGPYQMDRSFYLSYGGDRRYLPRYELAPPDMLDAIAYNGFRARGRSPWTADRVKCGLRAGLPRR